MNARYSDHCQLWPNTHLEIFCFSGLQQCRFRTVIIHKVALQQGEKVNSSSTSLSVATKQHSMCRGDTTFFHKHWIYILVQRSCVANTTAYVLLCSLCLSFHRQLSNRDRAYKPFSWPVGQSTREAFSISGSRTNRAAVISAVFLWCCWPACSTQTPAALQTAWQIVNYGNWCSQTSLTPLAWQSNNLQRLKSPLGQADW